MIDVCLLGTGGMMPLKNRFLTSMMMRYNGHSFLVDCGEATQISIQMKGWSFKDIDVLMITHFHADHISGLPGLLLAMSNAEKTTPLKIIGPKGINKVVHSLLIIAPVLNFQLIVREIDGNFETNEEFGLKINAFKVKHKIACYGYSFELERLPQFNLEVAKDLNVPVKYWNSIQHNVFDENSDYSLEEFNNLRNKIMGDSRKGIKITYVTDSRPTKSIEENAKNSDLFICEGMYGAKEDIVKAQEKTHMMMYEAATIAARNNVERLWLTHYSPSVDSPMNYKKVVEAIFENTIISKDRESITLNFD